MSYRPARSKEPLTVGRDDCPLAVFRSHPDFPGTLGPSVEGVWVNLNPSWPDASVDLILSSLEPPCHTDWSEFKKDQFEECDGQQAHVVYVRPGSNPQTSDAPPCDTCGSIMKRSGTCWKCPNCGTTAGCI